MDPSHIDRQLACAEYILAGHQGEPISPRQFPGEERIDAQGRRVWKRRIPHPGDGPKNINEGIEWKRCMSYADTTITYDIRHIVD